MNNFIWWALRLTRSGVFWFFFLLIAALSYAGNSDYEEELLHSARYCSMVSQHQASDGLVGWPDYNGNYFEMCLPPTASGKSKQKPN